MIPSFAQIFCVYATCFSKLLVKHPKQLLSQIQSVEAGMWPYWGFDINSPHSLLLQNSPQALCFVDGPEGPLKDCPVLILLNCLAPYCHCLHNPAVLVALGPVPDRIGQAGLVAVVPSLSSLCPCWELLEICYRVRWTGRDAEDIKKEKKSLAFSSE